MQALRIVETKDVSATELGSLYDEILAPSFRPAELESRAKVLDALTGDKSGPGGLLAVNPAGLIVGTIIGDWFGDCRVMLISYLAVRPGFRGCGVGKLLLAEAFASWRERFAPALILGEVEDPRCYREHDPRVSVTPMRDFDCTGHWGREYSQYRISNRHLAAFSRACTTCC